MFSEKSQPFFLCMILVVCWTVIYNKIYLYDDYFIGDVVAIHKFLDVNVIFLD